MPVAARDEALDVGEDIVGQARRGGVTVTAARRPRWPPSASSHAPRERPSLSMFSTVSSGYALKNTSAGTWWLRRNRLNAGRSRAPSGGYPYDGLPDRVQPREDHLGELVDVTLPRAVVVADHHQPAAVVDDEPADEMNRADADERARRRQPLRVRVDGGHHGADAVDPSRLNDGDERQLVLRDDVFAEGRRQWLSADGISSPGTSGAGTAQVSSATLEYGDRRGGIRLPVSWFNEPEQRIAVEAGHDALRPRKTFSGRIGRPPEQVGHDREGAEQPLDASTTTEPVALKACRCFRPSPAAMTRRRVRFAGSGAADAASTSVCACVEGRWRRGCFRRSRSGSDVVGLGFCMRRG